ncbi:MAG: phosphoenolpyruvate carboxykinase (ATP) [Myxococcota bacterium]
MTNQHHSVDHRRWINLPACALVEHAIRRGEGKLSANGALVVHTGQHTGRSPKDKWIVQDDNTRPLIHWGSVNQPMTPQAAGALHDRIAAYLNERETFVQDCYAGGTVSPFVATSSAFPELAEGGAKRFGLRSLETAFACDGLASRKNGVEPPHTKSSTNDKVGGLRLRVVTERAWHGLFARNMFRPVSVGTDDADTESAAPDFVLLHAPGFQADPRRHGTRGGTAVVIDFTARRVTICGTEFAGEIKKSVFTILNHLLLEHDTLGMHCAANVGPKGDVALLFGLSGTGKTTLSADPTRQLIGDDEHGWSPQGIFNFEGGCYAKVIRLDRQAEPQIFAACHRFGAVLENVVMDNKTRNADFADARHTENTRASYPLNAVPDVYQTALAAHPSCVVLLTCDAFGVLPPLSRLSPPQAVYHFLSGYTAKIPGTERGVTEPQAVFSTCFGAPFMPRHPAVYAALFGRRIKQHNVRCFLLNTGWVGGPYGVGRRIPIGTTRALLQAALTNTLGREDSDWVTQPAFGFAVPKRVPNVDATVLQPWSAWQDQPRYQETLGRLVRLFQDNMRTLGSDIPKDVLQGGPVLKL